MPGAGVCLKFCFTGYCRKSLAGGGGQESRSIRLGVLELYATTEQVISVSPVATKVQCGIVEDLDEVGESIDHLLPLAELVLIVEVGNVDDPPSSFASANPAMILLIFSPISLSPTRATMSAILPPWGSRSTNPGSRRVDQRRAS